MSLSTEIRPVFLDTCQLYLKYTHTQRKSLSAPSQTVYLGVCVCVRVHVYNCGVEWSACLCTHSIWHCEYQSRLQVYIDTQFIINCTLHLSENINIAQLQNTQVKTPCHQSFPCNMMLDPNLQTSKQQSQIGDSVRVALYATTIVNRQALMEHAKYTP